MSGREPRPLLLVRAGDDHRAGAEAGADDRRADSGAAPAELLADERALEQRELRPAVLGGDVEVHQPDLVGPGDDLARVGLVLVVLGRLGPDLLLGELARELSQRLLLVGERERQTGRGSMLDYSHG